MEQTQVVPFSGARLRGWRGARGMSQATFARALVDAGGREVSTMTVSNWERGKLMPRPEDIELIAAALGCKPAELGAVPKHQPEGDEPHGEAQR